MVVLGFGGADIVASEASSDQLTVTLSGVAADAVAFTDHPHRQFSLGHPDQVVAAINAASADPLNAALVSRVPTSREPKQVVVQQAASFDAQAATLTLQVTLIAAETAGPPVAMTPGQTTGDHGMEPPSMPQRSDSLMSAWALTSVF